MSRRLRAQASLGISVLFAGAFASTACSGANEASRTASLASSSTSEPAPVESGNPSPALDAIVSASASLAATAAPVVDVKATVPDLPKGTSVLHVGDSFVHSGLTQELRPKLEALGVRYEVHAEKSTNSLDWAKRVPALVASMQPDLVIITLGGNEIASQHLDVEARAVKRIVEAIGNRPCVWTTPPLWREESGVFDTIQASLAPCRFFETDVVVGKFIPRRADKIHPTMAGGAMWADALYSWLIQERTGAPKPWSMREAPLSERSPKGKRGPLPQNE
jgi:hypothetical protein